MYPFNGNGTLKSCGPDKASGIYLTALILFLTPLCRIPFSRASLIVCLFSSNTLALFYRTILLLRTRRHVPLRFGAWRVIKQRTELEVITAY